MHERYNLDFKRNKSEIAYQYAVNLCLIQIGEAAGKLIYKDHIVILCTDFSGPIDKLKRNGFLYGILIISIAGGHFL